MHHSVARDKTLFLDPASESFTFNTDERLLMRILVNMTKNALEAVTRGQRVTMFCKLDDDGAIFSVHNPGIMSHSVQSQLFQRSFSTRGSNRGLGTYSIKLFAEKYLK